MKYAIVIPDGAADEPHPQLGGLTALAAAKTPHMDWIAAHGKVGTVQTVPRGLPCGSDVAIMSVIGYVPKASYTGRAPLEAAAQNLAVRPEDWIFRCNLVTIVDDIMEDHSAGHISSEEGSALIDELNRMLAGPHVRFYPGVSYRHLMTLDATLEIKTTPPHDILGKPIGPHLPAGAGADLLRTLIDRSQDILGPHEINSVRRDLGENPATSIWLWGQGKMPRLTAFADRYHLRGAAITAVDLVRGLAKLIGWDIINVPGATGYLDTDYAGKGRAACKALADHDLVLVHVEAPDEAGHAGNLGAKVQSIEQIDRHIVGPILDHFAKSDQPWRILVLPDHPTPVDIRTHTAEAVPFAMGGAGLETIVERAFTEQAAHEADMHIQRGHELMEYFLTVH